jgi:ParB family chromosome partitioning protein
MSKPPPGTRPLPATTDQARALVERRAKKVASEIHAFDKAAEIAERVKDIGALRDALIGKLRAQRDFARKYLALFPQGGDRKSKQYQADSTVRLIGEEWCLAHTFHVRAVRRWTELLDPAILDEREKSILKRCRQIIELWQAANYSSWSIEWYTPERYLEAAREVLGEIDLDPASNEQANTVVGAADFFSKEDDGLARDWHGKVFMNPPYGKTADGDSLAAAFCNKAIEQFEAGNVEACIILVNSVHSQSWQAPLFEHPFCLVDHRIQFISADGEENKNPTYQNMFVYLGRDVDKFAEVFARFGYVARKIERAMERQS